MIPEFVSVLGRVAQQGIEVTHHGDYGARLAVSFATILDQ